MPNNMKMVYWDTCVWVAYSDDKSSPGPNVDPGDWHWRCTEVVRRAAAKELRIFTSELTVAEAYKIPPGEDGDLKNIPEMFDVSYISLVPVEMDVIIHARRLMRSGVGSIRICDAIHLSSAVVAGVDELHTFDNDLLKLDGKVDFGKLSCPKICWPSQGEDAGLLPLLDKNKMDES